MLFGGIEKRTSSLRCSITVNSAAKLLWCIFATLRVVKYKREIVNERDKERVQHMSG